MDYAYCLGTITNNTPSDSLNCHNLGNKLSNHPNTVQLFNLNSILSSWPLLLCGSTICQSPWNLPLHPSNQQVYDTRWCGRLYKRVLEAKHRTGINHFYPHTTASTMSSHITYDSNSFFFYITPPPFQVPLAGSLQLLNTRLTEKSNFLVHWEDESKLVSFQPLPGSTLQSAIIHLIFFPHIDHITSSQKDNPKSSPVIVPKIAGDAQSLPSGL